MTTDVALADLYRQMLRIRRFEERCVDLYSAQQVRGFTHLYIGQEAVATGVISQLAPEDAVVATYREHGHALARGVPMGPLMAEMLGRVTGPCRGRGGSMHVFHAATRFYGGNAIVAGGIPLAVGLALGDAMQGKSQVTACFFGEGAMAEGAFHESLNLAALWRLPVLFCCENNRYAMGTALQRSQSQGNLAVKAAAYQVPAWSCDGMDARAMAEAARRFRAHSMYDPDRYRDKAEIDQWKERDPLRILGEVLHHQGIQDWEQIAAMDASVVAEVDAAVTFAESSALEEVGDLTRFVTSGQAG